VIVVVIVVVVGLVVVLVIVVIIVVQCSGVNSGASQDSGCNSSCSGVNSGASVSGYNTNYSGVSSGFRGTYLRITSANVHDLVSKRLEEFNSLIVEFL
jgi:hypothetical protein